LDFFSRAAEFLRQSVGQKALVTELSHKPPRRFVSLLFFAATGKKILFRPLTYSRAELGMILIEKG